MAKKKEKKKNYHPFKKDENGNILSFRFFVLGDNPLTNKKKIYSTVWKIPQHLIGEKDKEVEHERLKAELAFRDEVKEKSKFILPVNVNDSETILFMDYARDWTERLLIRHPEGYNYYNRAIAVLEIFKDHFDKLLLKRDFDNKNTTPLRIQKFYDWLCTRTYTKTVTIVKRSVEELIQEKKSEDSKFKHRMVAESCGFTKTTLIFARRIGQHIELATAKAICKFFNVRFDKYFETQIQEFKYSKEANASIKRMLISILYDAKKKGVIDNNYANWNYTDPITGTVREKRDCYDEDEASVFAINLFNEKDIRKKTAFAIYILAGLRGSEVCGLEWSDIDLVNKKLSVKRNHGYYGKKFGSRDKAPKSKTSKRTITISSQLVEILKEYKIWWDNQKILHGDLWEHTDKLMVTDDGKTRVSNTLSLWLKQAQCQYGVRHISPHLLRHTNITLQINAGVPIKTVSERAGHSDVSITMEIYNHSLKKKEIEAADILDNIFTQKLETAGN